MSDWNYADPSTHAHFSIVWDEQDDCYAILYTCNNVNVNEGYEQLELEQIGTIGADGLTVFNEYADSPLPWPVIEQALILYREPREETGPCN